MTKRFFGLITILAIVAVLAACGSRAPRNNSADVEEEAPVSQATSAEAPAEQAEEAPVEQAQAPAAEAPAQEADASAAVPPAEDSTTTIAAAAPAKYGLASGPIDDKGFNQLAWEGLQRAGQEIGLETGHTLITAEDDYTAKINGMLKQGSSGIVSVGFGLAQATKSASEANPDVAFLNVDFPSLSANDLGLLFSTDEPAFMAGYLAAGMTQSGVVCTYGGNQYPPVMSFLVGFEHGIKYFNQVKGANVQLLGWQTDPENTIGGTGVFANDFENRDTGRTIAEDFFNQGCDIIFPVAGGTGLGSAEAAQARGLKVIGVDADQTQTNPEFANSYLTSVMKKIDLVVYEAVKRIESGEISTADSHRSNFIGTLSNDGVGLAPFHSFDSQVSPELKAELGQISEALMVGTLSTGWPISRSGDVNQVADISPETGTTADNAPAGSAAAGLTLDALRNATYISDWTENGTATLVNGEYREAAAPGSATETVIKMSEFAAFGDLTGNGAEDAAVILVTDPGGSGTFYDLAAVVNWNSTPVNLASFPLGDRVQVQSLSIQNGEVVVNMITHGPDDPMCCPTEQVTKRFSLQLAEESESDAGSEAPDFAGTYNAQLPSASSPGINVTLSLNQDGTAQMVSDYMNGQAPIIESGTWSSDGNSATVTFTSLNGRAINDEITFELQDGVLVSTVYDKSVYGSEGLKLNKQ